MKHSITDQVAEESGVGEVDLIPVIRVQPGSLILWDIIIQLDLMNCLNSCLEDVKVTQVSQTIKVVRNLPNKQMRRCACD